HARLCVCIPPRISSVPCSTRLCVVTPRRIALWPRIRGRRAHGTLVTLPDVESTELGNNRDLVIWLPPGYARSQRRYPVIYMHDGQNLFDPRTSYAEPGRGEQGVERA